MPTIDEQIKPQMFHDFLRDKIDQSDIPQIDIAKHVNFDQANIISMFKSGKTKVSLHVIPDLAKYINADPKKCSVQQCLNTAMKL